MLIAYSMPSRDTTYYDLKHRPESTYRYVKSLLRGHLRPPTILSHFEKCGELHSTGCSSEDDLTCLPPFRGWIVSGEKWESFTIDGRSILDPTEFVVPIKVAPEPTASPQVENASEVGNSPSVKVASEGDRAESPLLVTPPAPPPRTYSDILIQGQRLTLEDKNDEEPRAACEVV